MEPQLVFPHLPGIASCFLGRKNLSWTLTGRLLGSQTLGMKSSGGVEEADLDGRRSVAVIQPPEQSHGTSHGTWELGWDGTVGQRKALGQTCSELEQRPR